MRKYFTCRLYKDSWNRSIGIVIRKSLLLLKIIIIIFMNFSRFKKMWCEVIPEYSSQNHGIPQSYDAVETLIKGKPEVILLFVCKVHVSSNTFSTDTTSSAWNDTTHIGYLIKERFIHLCWTNYIYLSSLCTYDSTVGHLWLYIFGPTCGRWGFYSSNLLTILPLVTASPYPLTTDLKTRC